LHGLHYRDDLHHYQPIYNIFSLMIPLISDFMDDASHTCDAGHSTPTAMLWCVYSKKGTI